MIAAIKPVAPERALGELIVKSESDRWTFKMDAAATIGGTDYGKLAIVSAVSDHAPVQALRAALSSNIRTEITLIGGPFLSCHNIYRSEHGYRCRIHKLGVGTYHLMAIAKVPGLLPVVNEESLYQEFKSDRYTTPLVREFVPYIADQLRKQQLLIDLDCFQCEAGMLEADDEELDAVVEAGVAYGHLQIN